jgi:hypothetical protein
MRTPIHILFLALLMGCAPKTQTHTTQAGSVMAPETISVGMTKTETLRRLRQSGAVEVAKDLSPDGKGWGIAGRSDCLFLSFTNDMLAGIGVELNADRPKMYRVGYATNSYRLR